MAVPPGAGWQAGVLFFRNTDTAREMVQEWARLSRIYQQVSTHGARGFPAPQKGF
jgi:hypothetical protein